MRTLRKGGRKESMTVGKDGRKEGRDEGRKKGKMKKEKFLKAFSPS